MENELTDGVRISFNLVVIAAIVAIVVGFGVYTQAFKRDQINAISESQLANYSAELREVEGYGAVPVPTLYALFLKSESTVIIKPVTVYDIAISKMEDLTAPELLGKKVRIVLTPAVDRFEVTILEEE